MLLGYHEKPLQPSKLELPTINPSGAKMLLVFRSIPAPRTGDLSVEDLRSYHTPNSKHSYNSPPTRQKKNRDPPFAWRHYMCI